MNAAISIRARLDNASGVAQKGARFLLAQDHRRASLAVNRSKRLKVKAVLRLPRLLHSPHPVLSLRHSQRRKVAKEEGKVRQTNLP